MVPSVWGGPGGGRPLGSGRQLPPQLTVGRRPLGGVKEGRMGGGGSRRGLGGGGAPGGSVGGGGSFGVHGASGAFGAHGRLRATPLATNCWPEAPGGGGGGRGSWRPRSCGVAPPQGRGGGSGGGGTPPPAVYGHLMLPWTGAPRGTPLVSPWAVRRHTRREVREGPRKGRRGLATVPRPRPPSHGLPRPITTALRVLHRRSERALPSSRAEGEGMAFAVRCASLCPIPPFGVG